MGKLLACATLMALMLTALLPAPGPAQAQTGQPPAPTLIDRNPNGSTGDWYLGATPPDAGAGRPVLVFVHGLNSTAESWWQPTRYHGRNDMYAQAYQQGYRTAFVQLGGGDSVWANGTLLQELLDEIAQHFGVEQVVLVTHSKGGVDANAASAHAGAAPRIGRVITLGTPHWGSPLADLAYSAWTWWLAALLGYRNDATYNMQTGYMAYFRSVTDGRDPTVPYYSLSGNGCGPVFSALWLGCLYIEGEDDGLVPVWSARQKPGGVALHEGPWDHDEIRMASRTWAYLAPVLTAAGPGTVGGGPGAVGRGPAERSAAGPGRAVRPRPPGNLILRGGEVPGNAPGGAAPGWSTPGWGNPAGSLPLDPGVRQVVFTFYASSPDLTATLTAPDGRRHAITLVEQVPADEVFAGAWRGQLAVPAPAPGRWQFAATAPVRTGYLLVAALDGGVGATLELGQGTAAPGRDRPVGVRLLPGPVPQEMQARVAVSLNGGPPHNRPALTAAPAGGLQGRIALPEGPGIHNVTVTLTGRLPGGWPFERTLVGSFPAVEPARRGIWQGP